MKSAFGSVISTVVQQQDEILHMNHQMQKIAEENAKQQRNIVVIIGIEIQYKYLLKLYIFQ